MTYWPTAEERALEQSIDDVIDKWQDETDPKKKLSLTFEYRALKAQRSPAMVKHLHDQAGLTTPAERAHSRDSSGTKIKPARRRRQAAYREKVV